MRFSNQSILRAVVAACVLVTLAASCAADNSEKDKALWMCYDANKGRLGDKDSVCFYLDKSKATGFNHVIVDWEAATLQQDWDCLEYLIAQAHKRGIKVTVSLRPFSVGSYFYKSDGLCYLNEETCKYTCVEYLPTGMKKIEDDPNQVIANLNPAHPYAKEFGLNLVRKVLSGYNIDGLALDYCRYMDQSCDFSEYSRGAFEEYLGVKLKNFPEDIFKYGKKGEMVPGPYYKQWWTWRAGVIRSFIASVREEIDATKPDVELEYWAASWLHALYTKGQNWASCTSHYYDGLPWAEEDYCKTGFAELLNTFITGTYLERVWGLDDNESVEYGLARSNRDCAGACKVQGSLYAINHKGEFEDAVYVCMKNTTGVMVFDLVHVVNLNLWDQIKAGIDRAENELK